MIQIGFACGALRVHHGVARRAKPGRIKIMVGLTAEECRDMARGIHDTLKKARDRESCKAPQMRANYDKLVDVMVEFYEDAYERRGGA